MHCPECGQPIAPNNRFCANCGLTLESATPSASQASPTSHGAPPPSTNSVKATGKLLTIGVLLLEMVAIFGVAATLFSMTIGGAVIETFPRFCLAIWIGFLLSGSRELKTHLGIRSHATIFLVLYLISFLPLIYTQDRHMFADSQQQSVGMGIVFVFVIAFAAIAYHFVARFMRGRRAQARA